MCLLLDVFAHIPLQWFNSDFILIFCLQAPNCDYHTSVFKCAVLASLKLRWIVCIPMCCFVSCNGDKESTPWLHFGLSIGKFFVQLCLFWIMHRNMKNNNFELLRVVCKKQSPQLVTWICLSTLRISLLCYIQKPTQHYWWYIVHWYHVAKLWLYDKTETVVICQFTAYLALNIEK